MAAVSCLIASPARAIDANIDAYRINPGWSTGDMFGFAVAGLGDVNGDGVPDYLSGAPNGGGSMGKAFVLSGADGMILSMWFGSAGGDNLGWSVANAGDVNQDGVEDFMIGAPGMGANHQGAAKVISGATNLMLYLLSGRDPDERTGFSVTGAGDVNGDGYADVAVGAPFRSINGSSVFTGAVTLYSGQDGSVLLTLAPSNQIRFGSCLAGLGDVNNDGFPDIAVAAPGSGRVYVFDAHNNGVIRTITGLPSDHFGKSLANAGDFNNDGINDVVIGSDDGAFIYDGQDGHLLQSFLNRLGEAVAGPGDIDGDGYDDVLIASTPTIGAPTGRAQIRAGGTSGMLIDIIAGHAAGDEFGFSAAGIGDINGDDIPDFAVGAPGYDSQRGALYVFLGNPHMHEMDVSGYSLNDANPKYVTTLDIDGHDGADLAAIATQSGKIHIQLNRGDGTFADPTVLNPGARPTSAVALDVNFDGDRDFIVACAGDNRLRFYRNLDGELYLEMGMTTGRRPSAIVAEDFNRDGFSDIAVANRSDNNVRLYRHNHLLFGSLASRYAPGVNFAAGPGPSQLSVGDFNADFYPDLAVGNTTTPQVAVLINNKTGGFRPRRVLWTGNSVASLQAVDLNKDFRADLVWANPVGNLIWVALNTGTGQFNSPVAYSVGIKPVSIAVQDMDYDGYLDLAVVCKPESAIKILLNNQTGQFGEVVTYQVPAPPDFLTCADLDNDGDSDLIAVGGAAGATTVLLNRWYED